MPTPDATRPSSLRAESALSLVEDLQGQLVERMEGVAAGVGVHQPFAPVHWLRDGGTHGGGTRYGTGDTAAFNRASVNVSGVHYGDDPTRALASANALSTIVHPDHPAAPSMHMHISWTELKSGRAYWRVMADLNPCIPVPEHAQRFRSALQGAAPSVFEAGAAQGDRYFHIPAMQRHRGVAHFYLEAFDTGDWGADAAMARRVGEAVIRVYGDLLAEILTEAPEPSTDERREQLAYHTLYLLQVLTLDRGTTSGLMVHGDNDVGILGSLPARVDRDLLASWRSRMQAPQDALLMGLVRALPEGRPSEVTVEAKRELAAVVREHYRAHPAALELQARGDVVPPTVANHR